VIRIERLAGEAGDPEIHGEGSRRHRSKSRASLGRV